MRARGQTIHIAMEFRRAFPPAETRKVLSVWELTADVKRLLETKIGSVWVGGEITNLRAQSSGHVYFTLKDAAAQLSCVLFRNAAPAASANCWPTARKWCCKAS